MRDADETDLLARCRRGEAEAWGAFFDRHQAAVGRFVVQLQPGLTPEDVEEVRQETFLAAIRHLAGFDGRSAVQTWLCRIAANKARDFAAKARAAKRGGGAVPASLDAPDPATGATPDAPDAAPGPDERLMAREEQQAVRAALDALGDPCRELLELRYLAELDYAAIAGATGLREKTVSSRLSRCLDKLGELLAAGRVEPPAAQAVQ